MPPQEWLPFFGDSARDLPPESHEEEGPEEGSEKRESDNPYVEPNGECGREAYNDGVAYMCELRKQKPYLSDAKLVSNAIGHGDCHGHEWEMAFSYAIKNGEVPPGKKLKPTTKVVSPNTLRRYGGNPNADRAAQNDK